MSEILSIYWLILLRQRSCLVWRPHGHSRTSDVLWIGPFTRESSPTALHQQPFVSDLNRTWNGEGLKWVLVEIFWPVSRINTEMRWYIIGWALILTTSLRLDENIVNWGTRINADMVLYKARTPFLEAVQKVNASLIYQILYMTDHCHITAETWFLQGLFLRKFCEPKMVDRPCGFEQLTWWFYTSLIVNYSQAPKAPFVFGIYSSGVTFFVMHQVSNL